MAWIPSSLVLLLNISIYLHWLQRPNNKILVDLPRKRIVPLYHAYAYLSFLVRFYQAVPYLGRVRMFKGASAQTHL